MAEIFEGCFKNHPFLNIKHFNLMGLQSFGNESIKKWPNALLRASGLRKYDASKWMFITMSGAQNRTTAFGCVAK
jgi:hypothetical protein